MPKPTPHEIAESIAQKNLTTMRKGSTNVDHTGGGEQAAAAFLAEITEGICSSCARLSVSPTDKHIGCSYDFQSPSGLARQLNEATFLHEQDCGGHTRLMGTEKIFIDEDGVVRYNYR